MLTVLQIDSEHRRQQIDLLTAELSRSKANAADLAAQLNQQRRDYWSATDAAEIEVANARNEINYWRRLAQRPSAETWQVAVFFAGATTFGFLAAILTEVWK